MSDAPKSNSNYYYWHASVDKSKPNTTEPKKLSEEEAKALHKQASTTVGSAWNAAGSFEERDVSKYAIDRLKTLFSKAADDGNNNTTTNQFTIIEVVSCSGEATLFFVRGKKRCGIEFQLELQWNYESTPPTPAGAVEQGRLRILNACVDELDELEVNLIDASTLSDGTKAQVEQLAAAVVGDVLKQLSEELLLL